MGLRAEGWSRASWGYFGPEVGVSAVRGVAGGVCAEVLLWERAWSDVILSH